MTQEQKDLLLKDLCSRVPYGVKVQTDYIDAKTLEGIQFPDYIGISDGYYSLDVMECKPYLFPLKSMTEEQKNELNDKLIELELKALNDEISHIEVAKFEIDYYLKNYFDYRGLIPMDLAIDATGLNIY